jgi:K+-sensing histidine kinase KdpD
VRSAGRRLARGLGVGTLAIAAVTLVIAAVKGSVEPTGLTALPDAIGWGFWPAGVVAFASFLTFEYFFVPPINSFAIARAEDGTALAIALVTAYVVSELARRAHAGAEEARARAREAEGAQARSTPSSRPGSRTAACGSTCATTGSEAHARMEAACWGCAIAS